MRRVTVLTHGRPAETREPLLALGRLAAARGVVLTLDIDETEKHELEGNPTGIELRAPASPDAQLCVALGGDGTILRALRAYARLAVPVFAVNFGQVGFLSTVEPDGMEAGFEGALDGTLETLLLPAIELAGPVGRGHLALNDVALHRKVSARVAELSYGVAGEEVGSVRCDGLVIATPAGSTGYNLANGGPVMAWGVEGMAVSFIAPHSLSARALLIAPDDELLVRNGSVEALTLSVDGRPVGEIAPTETLHARFADRIAMLAQVPGSSFYRRLREKFGALAR
jgi:NAD+ kinase